MADAEPVAVTPAAEATAGDNRINLSGCGEYESYSCKEQTCWATASFKAPFYEPTSRPTVDIVAVIDKSGSMRGVKLGLVKKTLLFVIDQLKECDRMSLVTYDSYVQLVFGLMKMDKANKERSKAFVESIVDGSSTNLCGGLIKGMEQVGLTHGGEKAQVQSVLLLTDGLANQGITSKEGILAEMRKMQDQGLHAVAIPSDNVYHGNAYPVHQVSRAPPNQRRGLHALFGRNARRQQNQQQQQQQQLNVPMQMQQAGPPTIPQLPPQPIQLMQMQQAGPPTIPQLPPQPIQLQQQQQQQQLLQQQQLQQQLMQMQQAGPPTIPQLPPQPMQQQQQQLAPPPPPPPAQQQAAPLPMQQQQQAVPAPPPPPPPQPMQQATPMQQAVPPPPLPPKLLTDTPPVADGTTNKPIPPGAKFDGTVYTFGFGSDHDATLLEAISTQGGGVYYYIDSNEKIPESFADCLGGLLSVMGQNLSLKMEVVGDNAMKAVHANRAINWIEPNKSCEIPMGDLQSEEERDIVLELNLPALPSPTQDTVLRTTLSYFNVINSELDTIQSDLVLSRGDGDRGTPSRSVDTQRNRILATAALKEAETLADQGKLQDAQKVLKDTVATIEKSLTAKETFCQALVSDLKKSLESMQSRQSYLGHGKLYMHSKMQSHSVQRSNFVDSNAYYQNSSKVAYRLKSKK